MFALLAQYKNKIEFFICFAIIIGVLYGVYSVLMYERSVGYNIAKSECTTKALNDEIAARKRDSDLRGQLEKAERDGIIRDQQMEVLSKSVASVDNRVRDTTRAIHDSLPTASIDALRKTADAALAVFGDCREKYAEMGRNAQGHASDVMKYQEAWEKPK